MTTATLKTECGTMGRSKDLTSKATFEKALQMAKSGQVSWSLADPELSQFDGFGLRDFRPIPVTLSALAKLIKYQCFFLNGNIDPDALNEVREASRRKFETLDA